MITDNCVGPTIGPKSFIPMLLAVALTVLVGTTACSSKVGDQAPASQPTDAEWREVLLALDGQTLQLDLPNLQTLGVIAVATFSADVDVSNAPGVVAIANGHILLDETTIDQFVLELFTVSAESTRPYMPGSTNIPPLDTIGLKTIYTAVKVGEIYYITQDPVHFTIEEDNSNAANFPYFLKDNGSLDYMGVQITRTDGSQKVWVPGTPEQPFPGGWVTPGTYTITLNQPRIHHHDSGVLTGTLRPEHQLIGLVVSESITFPGWENNRIGDPPEFTPSEWGQSFEVALNAGDTLHVAYGNEIVKWQERNGSDGIVVYCVEEQPQYRGGLWGTGKLSWSQARWNKLRSRIIEAADFFAPSTSSFYYGPPDGTLPAFLPADYQNVPGNTQNLQGTALGRFILHRAIGYLKDPGSWPGSLEDLKQLFEFYCNNIQLTFSFSDASAMHYHYAHGTHRYPPYLVENIQNALVGAVALGYDPNYEPLHRLLSHLAQRADMTLGAWNIYTYANYTVEGGISANRDDNAYTQWLWYTMNATDVGGKGGHNIKVWGPAFWARELFELPLTAASEQMLWTRGDGPYGTGQPRSPHGHEWTDLGIGPGYNAFYGQLEVQGAMWLWFTDTYPDSQLSRWARRDFLYQNPVGPSNQSILSMYFGIWAHTNFVSEPRDLQVTDQGGDALMSWSPVADPDLSHFHIYSRTSERGELTLVGQSNTTTFLHSGPSAGLTFYYQVAAVDVDGNEGSLSDQKMFTY